MVVRITQISSRSPISRDLFLSMQTMRMFLVGNQIIDTARIDSQKYILSQIHPYSLTSIGRFNDCGIISKIYIIFRWRKGREREKEKDRKREREGKTDGREKN